MLRWRGPPGPTPLFPLRGECYWCKMALCLSETPASWMELSWSNALWDGSVWFCYHFWLSLVKRSLFTVHGIEVCISNIQFLWWYVLSCKSSFCCSSGNIITLDAEQSLPPPQPPVDSSLWFFLIRMIFLNFLRISHVMLWSISFAYFLFNSCSTCRKGRGIISSVEQISTRHLEKPTCTVCLCLLIHKDSHQSRGWENTVGEVIWRNVDE